MKRFILRFGGDALPSEREKDKIRALPGVVVVDDSNTLLVIESRFDRIQDADVLRKWDISEERTYSVPKTRLGLRRTLARAG